MRTATPQFGDYDANFSPMNLAHFTYPDPIYLYLSINGRSLKETVGF